MTDNTHQFSPEEAATAIAAAQKGATNATTPQRPESVPEKFWDAEKGTVKTEALLQSYSELERRQSAPKPEEKPNANTPPKIEDGKAEETPPEASREQAQEAVEKANLDFSALEQEYLNDGKLSDETYEKLAKAGLPKNVVDNYVEGQMAKAQALTNRVYDTVGGEQSYMAMNEWAKQNLSDSEKAAFNAALDSGNEGSIMLAVRGLQAQFTAANGKPPKLVNGDAAGQSGAVFRSRQEVITAMSDPRYRSDPAYRSDVEAKLLRSDVI